MVNPAPQTRTWCHTWPHAMCHPEAPYPTPLCRAFLLPATFSLFCAVSLSRLPEPTSATSVLCLLG